MFLRPSAKAGHWETEKAGCGRADLSPKNVSQKTCSDVASSVRFAHRSDRFVQAPKCLAQKSECRGALFALPVQIVPSQKNAAVVIFI